MIDLKLKKEIFNEMMEHSREIYPYECCGIVAGKADDRNSDIIYRCKNIQDKLHNLDPKRYPRDSRTAYSIDPKQYMDITSELDDKGFKLKYLYHSHPEHDAYFSEEDKLMALLGGKEPAFPDICYIVLSLYSGIVKGFSAFAWNSDTGDFARVELILY